MNHLFELAAGTVIGRSHRRLGRNNQDAYQLWSTPQATIAVVCDGCGSCPHTEVGAKVGARLVVKTLSRYLVEAVSPVHSANSHGFWQQLHQDLLQELSAFAMGMGTILDSLDRIIHDYFLFTIVGALITPEWTFVFSLGDGVALINDQVILDGSIASNAPPYLGYGLLSQGEKTPFQVSVTPTDEVQRLVLGSDGITDLENIHADSSITKVFQPFWQGDRYFQNPDQVRRFLAQCNREILRPDWENQVLDRQGGQLEDDTTLVLIRRKCCK